MAIWLEATQATYLKVHVTDTKTIPLRAADPFALRGFTTMFDKGSSVSVDLTLFKRKNTYDCLLVVLTSLPATVPRVNNGIRKTSLYIWQT